jgi:uncharacterized membrane protein YoaK (UPF0700 family)
LSAIDVVELSLLRLALLSFVVGCVVAGVVLRRAGVFVVVFVAVVVVVVVFVVTIDLPPSGVDPSGFVDLALVESVDSSHPSHWYLSGLAG